MNPCQPGSPVSYVVYLRTNPLAYYFFRGRRERERERRARGRWRKNGDREDCGARHVHEAPSNNEFRRMRWILNRARRSFGERAVIVRINRPVNVVIFKRYI